MSVLQCSTKANHGSPISASVMGHLHEGLKLLGQPAQDRTWLRAKAGGSDKPN